MTMALKHAYKNVDIFGCDTKPFMLPSFFVVVAGDFMQLKKIYWLSYFHNLCFTITETIFKVSHLLENFPNRRFIGRTFHRISSFFFSICTYVFASWQILANFKANFSFDTFLCILRKIKIRTEKRFILWILLWNIFIAWILSGKSFAI